MKPTVKFFNLATLALGLSLSYGATRVDAGNGSKNYTSRGSGNGGGSRSSYAVAGGVSSGGYYAGGGYSHGRNNGVGYPRPYYGNRYYGGGYGYGGYGYGGSAYYGRGCGNNYWGVSAWVPWSLSFSYASAPVQSVYYDYAPPVVSYQPTVVYSSAPAVAYSAPPVVYSYPPPAATPAANPPAAAPAPAQNQPPHRVQSISVADVKALAKAGLSDEVIISQIHSAQSIFHLSTAEIIELKENGVSEKVINYLINTANTPAASPN